MTKLVHRPSALALALVSWLLLLPTVASAAALSPVQQQLEVLIDMARAKRIGLITNASGCDELGNLDSDYLVRSTGTSVTAFFAPEHGLRGSLPPGVSGGDYIDPITGIPVYAVYGARNAPTDAQLATVDLLAFDLQDVGARFYTFVWTMTYCMEAAARNGKPFIVIDRPNPIGGTLVEGAVNTVDYGLVGRLGRGASFGVASRHGMTAGEIASWWNGEFMSPKVDLRIIVAPGWRRTQWWNDTGRLFVAPSPNMRTPEAAAVYPGTCIFEGSNLSEGRGTARPFETIGAPFIDANQYAARLNDLTLPGAHFAPISFTPTSSKWSGQLCGGVLLTITNRNTFQPVRTGLFMLQTARQMYPSQVNITSYASTLMATPNLASRLDSESVDAIIAGWQPAQTLFVAQRAHYLLYPEGPTAATDWRWLK